MKHHPIPVAWVREHLTIDLTSPTGLRWIRCPSNGRKAGAIAGSSNGRGYYQVRCCGVSLRANRVAYALHYGIDPGLALVDHRDGNRTNNDPLNLRLSTVAQNTHNQTLHRSNRSGVKGLSYWAVRDRWRCEVGVNGKRATRSFPADQKAVAVQWLRSMREALHGEFANHGDSAQTAWSHSCLSRLST